MLLELNLQHSCSYINILHRHEFHPSVHKHAVANALSSTNIMTISFPPVEFADIHSACACLHGHVIHG